MLSNYSKTCAKNLPGNRAEVYITEIGNITSITDARLVVNDGDIHSITEAGGKLIIRLPITTTTTRTIEGLTNVDKRFNIAGASSDYAYMNGAHVTVALATIDVGGTDYYHITTATTYQAVSEGAKGNVILWGNTDNLIETVVMGAGLKFHKFQVDIDTIQATNTAGNNANEFKLIFKLAVHTKSVETFREALSAAVVGGVAAIRVDGNNRCFLSGASDSEKEGLTRPYTKVEYTFDSGIMPTDENMQALTVTLTRQGGVNETEFDATNTAAILAGTAPLIEW